MQIQQIEKGDVSVVGLRGRLVAGVGDVMLRDAMNGLLAEGSKKILLDLSEVTHIDSSGIGELVASRMIARRFGAGLKVVRVEDGVESVFEIARILPLFSFYNGVDDALLAFHQEPPPAAEDDELQRDN